MKGLSLFSNVGIGETYLEQIGIEIIVANELLEDRAEFYKKVYPKTQMICGDITDPEIYSQIIESSRGVDLLMATPPCQGMSAANAMKKPNDPRNSLIKKVVAAINDLDPTYILIENVRAMQKTFINHNGSAIGILEFIKQNISPDYEMHCKVLNSSDLGTPQHRKRLITLISKGGVWKHPESLGTTTTVRQAIGHLPSLESEEKTDIPWHFGRKHNSNHILWMKNTPTGKTAFDNRIHYPKTRDKDTGMMRRIKGFRTTYKRIEWDEPSPTIGMTNGAINSQNNVHPGSLLEDGTYSDARVLSVKEIVILCGLPETHYDKYEGKTAENFLRHVLGECFPPRMCLEICKKIPTLP